MSSFVDYFDTVLFVVIVIYNCYDNVVKIVALHCTRLICMHNVLLLLFTLTYFIQKYTNVCETVQMYCCSDVFLYYIIFFSLSSCSGFI